MSTSNWQRLGSIGQLRQHELQAVEVAGQPIALSYLDGQFGAISGTCLHVGGPLGEGTIQNGYVVCPWHHWMFHRLTGEARPGIPAAVPRYELKEENGDLFINLTAATPARHAPHPPHPLSREIRREPGALRVVGISTTAMDPEFPRFSTSEFLLQHALDHAKSRGAEAKLIRLGDLKFRNCEGYYSKSAHACTWPCSITQMDPADQLDRVYEALVFWADVVLVATPIRWGNASSLYYKLAERMNCVQNQVTIADRVLIRGKVASFIITGGQDNVQGVAGQLLTFFGELGFLFPQFPFIAHSRGWTAEDMERNVAEVRASDELKSGARSLVERCLEMAAGLVAGEKVVAQTDRGGRKANRV
ncbi:MAG: NAD(P)H-dependent oxidoreductase [Pirellulaceae bacterium]|nr:NAD(P)H-dependent oxidoreductase [Pirellulaceae bacterium]